MYLGYDLSVGCRARYDDSVFGPRILESMMLPVFLQVNGARYISSSDRGFLLDWNSSRV